MENFETSKIVQEVMSGTHRKPVWGDRLIEKTWSDCLEETKVVPELGRPLMEGPFDVDDPDEIKFGFRRFPREQKLNKVRQIDPAVGANRCSPLPKKVPTPTPHDMRVNAAVAYQPSRAGRSVVIHNRKVIKKCRKAAKRYEEQLLQFFKGERDSIGDDLIKKGGVQGGKTSFSTANVST